MSVFEEIGEKEELIVGLYQIKENLNQARNNLAYLEGVSITTDLTTLRPLIEEVEKELNQKTEEQSRELEELQEKLLRGEVEE